jgi:hypothetical protein
MAEKEAARRRAEPSKEAMHSRRGFGGIISAFSVFGFQCDLSSLAFETVVIELQPLVIRRQPFSIRRD